MINIDGKMVNPSCIMSAEIKTAHYMNGSVSKLVVKLIDGSVIVCEHGPYFDAFNTLKAIDTVKEAGQ